MTPTSGAITALVCAGAGCGRIDFGLRAGDAVMASDCHQLPGILFCDGFEDAALAGWTQVGTIAQVTSIVHSGSGALRVDAPSTSQNAGVGASPYLNLSTGSIHFRGWFYLPSGYATNKINLIAAVGQSPTDGVDAEIDTTGLAAYSAPGGGFSIPTSVPLPRDGWFCLEVHVDISSTNGAVRLDLDGAQIGRASGINTLATGGYTVLGAGALYLGPTQPAVTMYVDDVATGTLPIGCN
jgi:hypothetical protein